MLSTRSIRLAVLTCNAGMVCLAICSNLMPVFLTTVGADLGGLTNEQLGPYRGGNVVGGLVG